METSTVVAINLPVFILMIISLYREWKAKQVSADDDMKEPAAAKQAAAASAQTPISPPAQTPAALPPQTPANAAPAPTPPAANAAPPGTNASQPETNIAQPKANAAPAEELPLDAFFARLMGKRSK